jgi:uncharacterized membrane protein YdjX (TVP38/TMEM64 family)
MTNNKSRIWRRAPIVAILVVAVLGAVFLRPYLSFAMLAENRQILIDLVALHWALSVGAFIALYIVVVAFSLPGATVMTLTGGFLFGLFPGVLFNIAGASIGAVLIFLAVRMGFGEALAARIDAGEGAVQRLKRGIDDNQYSVLFLMRLVPAVPFFVANVLPALLNVPLGRYALTTALGIIPGALVITSVGVGLGDVIAAGAAPDLSVIFSPPILLPILGLAALAALPMLLKLTARLRAGPAG